MASVFELLKKIGMSESASPSEPPEFIIVGLGNPGDKYTNTRHNAGFMALSYLAQKETDASVSLATIPTIPQIRMTRRIDGAYTLAYGEMHKRFEDSIGMVSNWKKRGPVWEVPFGTLISPNIKNLLVAGRCTAVDDRLWDVMRVIPCCAVTGQAAGTAAAISSDFTVIDLKQLQSKLKQDGVILHEKDI